MRLLTRTLLLACLALPAPAGTDWIVVGPLPRTWRTALVGDPVLEGVLGGDLPAWPAEGDACGKLSWASAAENEKGRLESPALEGGYAYRRVTVESDRVVIAHVGGASSFFVNGEPFIGDVYGYDFVRVPVFLRKGDNHLLARCARGWVSLTLGDPPATLVLNPEDATLPDIVSGAAVGAWGAVPILNASTETVRGAVLHVNSAQVPLPDFAPLAVLKIPFPVSGNSQIRLRIEHAGRAHEETLKLLEREAGTARRHTFRSAIDHSVQQVSLLPPRNFDPHKTTGLILSLHGANVDSFDQASSYAPKDWAVVAAPNNRRRFGFDWEEWGRLDAFEALAYARAAYPTDPARTWLTGHSMGGHGTWHLATLFPDQWAAAAPSAGWVSFWSYGGAREPETDLGRLLRRAQAPSDTLALKQNLAGVPLFAIHGDADDNVPIAQMHLMTEELKGHADFRTHTEKGAGHWWDRDKAPGADCLDFPALSEFFQRRRRADELEVWSFRTVSPAASSRCRWLEIVAQAEPMGMSSVEVKGREVRTVNVVHLRILKAGEFLLDGQPVEARVEATDLYRDAAGTWSVTAPGGLRKTPAQQGPFTQAFHRPFLLVYGTGGDADETRAGLAKARFDSETWWYRGNGLARVVADTDLSEEDAGAWNLILYGSSTSNALWKRLDDRLPIHAKAGSLEIFGEAIEGDVAIAAIYPSPVKRDGFVGLVGATGPGGRRAWMSISWFFSGASIPDVLVWDARSIGKGPDGVRLAGFFGPDWKPYKDLWWHSE